jgi:hypothetical protein
MKAPWARWLRQVRPVTREVQENGPRVQLVPYARLCHLPPDVRRQMMAGDKGLTWIGIGSATD